MPTKFGSTYLYALTSYLAHKRTDRHTDTQTQMVITIRAPTEVRMQWIKLTLVRTETLRRSEQMFNHAL